jgi:hypothetical protein
MAIYKSFDRERFGAQPVFVLYFRRYAPFDEFGGGNLYKFEGDHRTSGSTSIKDTSRTYGCVYFTRSEILYGYSGTSGTRWAGFHSWTWVFPLKVLGGSPDGVVANAKVSLNVAENVRPDIIEFSASTAASMPLLPGTPNVDTFVKLRFDFTQKGSLVASGRVSGDAFPNLEVFLITPGQKSALLVDGRTTGSQEFGPIVSLWGSGEDQKLGEFNFALPVDDSGDLKSNFRAQPTTM